MFVPSGVVSTTSYHINEGIPKRKWSNWQVSSASSYKVGSYSDAIKTATATPAPVDGVAAEVAFNNNQQIQYIVVDPNFTFPWGKTMDIDRECLPAWFWLHLPSRAFNSTYHLYIGLS